jgi:hypothetical protein
MQSLNAHLTATCTAQVLERGLELLGSRPVVYRLNPKAMPRQQLLGSLNLDTREWSDGVLTAAARKVRGLAGLQPPQLACLVHMPTTCTSAMQLFIKSANVCRLI